MTPIWNRSNIHTATASQQTTPEWAQVMALIYMQDSADAHNRSLATDYQTAWKRYASDRDNQPAATNLPIPYPPTAQVVDVMPNGWPETVDGDTLVCVPNVYQPPKLTPDTHGLIVGGPGTPVVDVFATAVLYGKPVSYGAMKFLRVE